MSGHEPKDWETMEAIEPQAGEALERAMARYARLRLEPSPAQVRRARAAAMEAAWRSRIEARPAVVHRRRLPFSTWSLRRVSLAASAAVFAGLLLGSSVFAASRAGGPLYDARIALETATLPSDPSARLQAELANAQSRLAEAYDAAVRNDQGALTAALHAYAADASGLGNATGPDATQVIAAVQQHREVLLALIGRANANALPGLDQALASSDKAIERLSAGVPPNAGGNGGANPNGAGGNPNAGGGNPNAGGGAGSTTAPGASGNPNAGGGNGGAGGPGHPLVTPGATSPASPKPDHTPKADHSAKPGPTPRAGVTPKPEHTARVNSEGNGAANDNTATPSPAPSASPSAP